MLYSIGSSRQSILFLALTCCAISCLAHTDLPPVDKQARSWLESLGTKKADVLFDFDSLERFNFRWVPANRKGIRLDEMTVKQQHALSSIFRTVLSEDGEKKVDAIIATEAALGAITNSPDYRDSGKYYTTVFGQPGAGKWGLRFEGHHLSVNLTFTGSELISGTPLFLGANPETISSGPDQGLRALKLEVDEAKILFNSLTDSQKKKAEGSGEWFAGFLTDAGSRRADLGKPSGIPATELSDAQQKQLRKLIAAYVNTLNHAYASNYLAREVKNDWNNVHFFWKGGTAEGENFYYRIAGKRLFIEHDAHAGAKHIHAIWRDAGSDFGDY